ncbi:RHS repeat-associated core domain-containing protein [Arthrobacter sp. efr-133-TYG-118]|uniref:RHS repeat-associated core domain-containing protein n=1 Tax=Arthrobacter sp. efr-133-TYG-118 TaxID=3040279 RepID=UPI00254AB4BC|nr:RHS repeat-associated core domain-containing protein [Arthrobacter sp. efr-133-TYG-118]
MSGTLATLTSNYAARTSINLEIYDLDTGSAWVYCNTGMTCSVNLPSNGHRFIGAVGNQSASFPPSTVYAVSNQVGMSGPSGANETVGGPNPAELNQCFSCRSDPINTFTGEFFENTTDSSVPGRGPAMETTRSYSSQRAGYDSAFGFGWTFNYGMNLVPSPSGDTADVHQENGSMVTFTANSGAYVAPPRVLATLAHNADGSWTYTRKAKEIFDFDSNGLLTRMRDLNGNAIAITRDTAGHVTTVTDGSGRATTFAYDGSGHVTSATDPAGRITGYAYDGNGRLASVTAPAGAVTGYAYGTANLLTTITDPNGKTTTNAYDAAHRVTRQTDRNGGVTTFAYGGDGTTTTTSPAGRVIKETYINGQLATRIEGAGTAQAATWSYTYDPATFGTTKVTDPLNRVTTGTYDPSGNRLTSTDPAGHTTTYTYDSLNDVTSATDPAGTVTTLTYDAKGNLLTTSTPLTGTSQVSVVANTYGDTAHPGDVTSVTDPNGNTTTLSYDANGDRTAVTDALGRTTATAYDVLGRKISTTTPSGKTTSFTYNTAGLLATTTDPPGKTTAYTYDANGKTTAVTDRLGHTTSYTYDALGHQTSTTAADSTVTSSAYDSDGNLTSQTDQSSHITTYTYDSRNRLTSSQDGLNRTTSYAYDAAGQLTGKTDPSGRTTSYGYNSGGDRTSTSYSDGVTPNEAFTYTALHQPATIVDGTGTTAMVYDSLGRLTSRTNGAGKTIAYAYDLAGNATAQTYPNAQTVTRAYDAANNLTSLKDWLNNTTTFMTTADSLPATTAYANGVTATTSYDNAGLATAITDATATATLASFTYTRNDVGNLASTTTTGISQPAENYGYTNRDQLASVNTTNYGYDAAGNPTALTTGASLAYDAANQPTQITFGGTATAITYDNQGNRLTGPAPVSGTSTYTWNQANRLANANGTTFTYDATGLRASRTPATGPGQSYTWDTAKAVPLMLTDGTTNYIYDTAGNPVEQIDSSGAVQFYQHDQYGSTRLLTDGAGNVTATYTFDPNGNLTNKTGTADTPLRWNGQTQDIDTGLYYLRARYYDPITTQFISIDPLAAITHAVYNYATNNPFNSSDPLGLWSWNPFEWTGEEWAKVGAIAGVIALTAAVIGATVATGGAAAVVFTVIETTATLTGTAIGVGAAIHDCSKGFSEDCGYSLAGVGLSAVGLKYGSLLKGTAWESLHVADAARANARMAWGAVHFSGPAYDAINYNRAYCRSR